jgi:hypothetical protein
VPKRTNDSTIRIAGDSSNTSDVVKRVDANAHCITKTFVSTNKRAGQSMKRLCFACKS